MKPVEWSEEKNLKLKERRKISFEAIAEAVINDRILDIIQHPNKKRYPKQNMFVVEIDQYCYLVPYVEDDTKIFLKTCYASRKMTKKYLRKENI
jgi:hypothetical protein